MSAKAVAQSYWTKELEEELEELGIREKWLFTTNAADRPFSGSEEEAMEFVEKNRSELVWSATNGQRFHRTSHLERLKLCDTRFTPPAWSLGLAHLS
jgi:FMN phosphatase YigB (HAD superfamily)